MQARGKRQSAGQATSSRRRLKHKASAKAQGERQSATQAPTRPNAKLAPKSEASAKAQGARQSSRQAPKLKVSATCEASTKVLGKCPMHGKRQSVGQAQKLKASTKARGQHHGKRPSTSRAPTRANAKLAPKSETSAQARATCQSPRQAPKCEASANAQDKGQSAG
jgi:hypothetical protein